MSKIYLEFEDNYLLIQLFGPQNINLKQIEKQLGIDIISVGNTLTISGEPAKIKTAQTVLESLYKKLEKGHNILDGDFEAAMRISENGSNKSDESLTLYTRKSQVTPRSKNQEKYIRAMKDNDLVFGLGPAGTGKTYLAVAYGVSMLLEGMTDRIIISRPAVEAGENLGFLPGDLKEKVDPYLRPIYDALHDMMPAEQVQKRIETGEIEVAPLAFMRGRTLSNCFVILDEAQNTTTMQMKMFLTRLGNNSQMVVNGDLSQTDLPNRATSGLADAVELLKNTKDVKSISFTDKDVVRHNLVSRIIRAYDKKKQIL
ncbi:MAG: PhoH family protein [Alphaproteobacteria bacterium]|nr:PhoH family protein [Alphaproteobacteria bacterium]